VVSEGETHLLRVISIDPKRERIGLSLKAVTAREQIDWMTQRELAAAAAAEKQAEEAPAGAGEEPEAASPETPVTEPEAVEGMDTVEAETVETTEMVEPELVEEPETVEATATTEPEIAEEPETVEATATTEPEIVEEPETVEEVIDAAEAAADDTADEPAAPEGPADTGTGADDEANTPAEDAVESPELDES
jgi:translation initiation factor 2 alpha subunit (eIF-2alpha)